MALSLDRARRGHKYRVLAFVFMPEHVHLLAHPREGESGISALLKAIKRPFSYRIKQRLIAAGSPLLHKLTIHQRPGVTTFRFWQEGPGYYRNLTEPGTILAAIDYIHANVVRRGLCQRAIDWRWSSAREHLLDEPFEDTLIPKIDPMPPDLLE